MFRLPRPDSRVRPRDLHTGLRQPEDEHRVAERIAELEVPARRPGDELLAVHFEHRRCSVDSGAAVELPQHRAGLGIVRLEPAVALAGEHQAAGGGGRAAHHRQLGLHGPGDLAGVQVDRVDIAVLTASRSHTSCGTSWKPHLNLPLVASMAAIDSVQRLSPGRIEPSRSGDGLPIATNSVLLASSYAGVIHIEPPPCCHASAYLAESAFSWARARFRSSPSGVVLEKGPHQPPSWGDGMVYQVHTSAPLASLKAFT